MKKLFTLLILTYLLFTINSSAVSQNSNGNNPENEKIWIKHLAFAKLISLFPFGFLLSWVFYLPGITTLLEKSYEMIAKNRTKISTFLGLAACNISNDENESETTDINIEGNKIEVSIIPHTLNNTTLLFKEEGDYLNLETDMLSKYVEKNMQNIYYIMY